MIVFWFSRLMDKACGLLYPSDIYDDFWDGDEDDIY